MSIDGRPQFFTQREAFALWKSTVCRLSQAAGMNFDFISEIADDESTESSGTITGWENVVFELEDEPDPAANPFSLSAAPH
jgi:hypothetical protein